jgi:isoleucyl-tRNA synthetase
MDDDKKAAYSTLHEVLLTTVKAIAPFAPLLSDAIYGNLGEGGMADSAESVHLTDFPLAEEAAIDQALESNMDIARSIVMLGRAARNASGIKVRQPLKALFVAGVPQEARLGIEGHKELIQAELNIKAMEWTDEDGIVVKRAQPLFPSLGPKHGGSVNLVAEAIRNLTSEDVEALSNGKSISVSVADGVAVVGPEDVSMETGAGAGMEMASDRGLTVALDTSLTEDLRDEGFAREMINKIQFMRRQAGFDVMDRIDVGYRASPRLAAAIERFLSRIAKETLAESIAESSKSGEIDREWDINGERAWIALARVERRDSGRS